LDNCTRCGAELDLGRFCINCGAPVDASAPTPQPVDVPPVYGPASTYVLPGSRPAVQRRSPGRANGPGAAVWVFLLLGLLLAIVLGSCLALHTGNNDDPKNSAAQVSETPKRTGSTPSTPATSTGSGAGSARSGTDLAVSAKVSAASPMGPSRDVSGNRVSYPATNMLDKNRATAYRISGDGSGNVIRFDLRKKRTISAVGLINGYSKVDGGTNWYPRNRRILKVEWRFDDGTVVTQELVETPELQTIQIDPETTQTVQLRIIDVSKPGDKNTTAISDILLLGR
jgi:hypothetical protein